jgi:N-acetylmuramoyl-L-alanine amidase
MLYLLRKHPNRRNRRRPSASLLSLFLTAGLFAAELADSHHVTAVRFWSLGDVTRIAIETDGDFEVRSDRLTSPDRIFFDLAGTKPAIGPKSLTVIPVSDRFVRQIRVAEPQPNTTRVVLDLSAAAETTMSRLDNPKRLIIELRTPPGQPAAPKPASTPAAPTVQPATPAGQSAPAIRAQYRQFNPPAQSAVSPSSRRPQVALLDPPAMLEAPAPSSTLAAAVSVKLPPPPPAYRNSSTTALAKPSLPATPAAPAPLTASISPAENSLPAKRNSSGDHSMIRVLGLKVGRIVLDPGHGGHDTGTIGPEGLREKDLVLDVTKRLGALIAERMGSEVIYTRSDDTFIPLERRTEIANESKADLFLSIHANSSTLRTAAGVETYYLNFTTSKAALDLAARENAGSEKTIYELQDLLEKIALKDKVEESREFATRIESALYTLSVKTNAHAKDRGVKKAPFVVLIGASMPSVLAEIGFVSNAHDESTMKRAEYRQRIAEALYKGLSAYANTLSHFQVAQRQ